MAVAALYDIHGNLPALEAVLAEEDVQAAEVIVVGGDVAPGPFIPEVLDLLSALGGRVRYVRGNADRELIDAYEAWAAGTLSVPDNAPEPERMAAWAAARLNDAHRRLLATFEPTVSLTIARLGDVLFCHASPRSDLDIITSASSDEKLAALLTDRHERLIVAGHTHMQLDRTVEGLRFINPGSVGAPYEDEPGAYWSLLGPDVELRRTVYDYHAAAAVIRATGYPFADDLVEASLLSPIGRAQAIRHLDPEAG